MTTAASSTQAAGLIKSKKGCFYKTDKSEMASGESAAVYVIRVPIKIRYLFIQYLTRLKDVLIYMKNYF